MDANILSVEVQKKNQGGDLAVLRIDGRDFIEIVQSVERRIAHVTGEKELAGAYDYLPLHRLKSLSPVLLGEVVGDEKCSLLDSPCGEEEFWPLKAKISCQGDYLCWSEFEQPNREAWVYPDSFMFVFLRSQFEQEIRRLEIMGPGEDLASKLTL